MFDSPAAAGLAADLVLVTHAAFVAFVVFGQAYVLLGWNFSWPSARNPWFRRLHLAAIAVVVLQSWIGLTCPLTTLESDFRQEAGAGTYQQTFIAHWVSRLLYYDLPVWIFVTVYTLFGALVLLCYCLYPPRSSNDMRKDQVADS